MKIINKSLTTVLQVSGLKAGDHTRFRSHRGSVAFILAAFLGACVTTELRAQVIVVPNELATNEGNDIDKHLRPPVEYATCGFYDASQFGALSGPSLLTQFA